ncbi:MAG: putative zinc-binding metallopeptidase [Pirellulaceae bacterium]
MASQQTKNRSRRKLRIAEPDWVQASDEELLDRRICDLGLQIPGTLLEQRVQRLYEELQQRGITFQPHCWLSDDWFSPDGVPGIAIPFYMAHPRLARLERNQMSEVEGGNKDWCMRILRHEAGHAIDTAYRLHRRRSWQAVFGRASLPYPEDYSPSPTSKSYVLNLESWYAQSHPSEDYAETFAVWVKPRSRWRSEYADWPALGKLEYVDELMQDISGQKAPVKTRQRTGSVTGLRKTLREHYIERCEYYGIGDVEEVEEYDDELLRLFSNASRYRHRRSAASFLRQLKAEARRVVAQWTGQYQYTVDQVIGEMIQRSRELDLKVHRSEKDTRRDALILLTVKTMHYLQGGYHKMAM